MFGLLQKTKTKQQSFGKSFSQPTAAESQPRCSMSACQQLSLNVHVCSLVMQPCVSCLQHVKIRSTVSAPQKGHCNSVISTLSPFLSWAIDSPFLCTAMLVRPELGWGEAGYGCACLEKHLCEAATRLSRRWNASPRLHVSLTLSLICTRIISMIYTLSVCTADTEKKMSLGDGKDVCVRARTSRRLKVRQAGSRNKLPRWPTFWNPASGWAAQMFLQSLRSWNPQPWNPATTDSVGAGRFNCPSHATHWRHCWVRSWRPTRDRFRALPACACFNEMARVAVSIICDVRLWGPPRLSSPVKLIHDGPDCWSTAGL